MESPVTMLITVEKKNRQAVKIHCANHGGTMKDFINDAIAEKLARLDSKASTI